MSETKQADNEHDDTRVRWREQIERGWQQAQAGQLVDGEEVFRKLRDRLKTRRRQSNQS